MTRRKAVLILNPIAGGRQSRRTSKIARFCDALVGNGVDVDVVHTNEPLSASCLVQKAVQNGATDIVTHGGDGTINEALQGLVGLPVRVTVRDDELSAAGPRRSSRYSCGRARRPCKRQCT